MLCLLLCIFSHLLSGVLRPRGYFFVYVPVFYSHIILFIGYCSLSSFLVECSSADAMSPSQLVSGYSSAADHTTLAQLSEIWPMIFYRVLWQLMQARFGTISLFRYSSLSSPTQLPHQSSLYCHLKYLQSSCIGVKSNSFLDLCCVALAGCL